MAPEPDPHETKRIKLELVDKPPRRNPWRPTTLTVRAFVKICHHIERGFSIPNACDVEAISYRNFRHRVSRSPRLEKRLKEAEAVRFELRHEQAMATIMLAGEKSWPAHAWWAERNLPELYALKTVIRANDNHEKPIYAELTRDQLMASIARAKELEAEAPVGWQPPLPDAASAS